MANSNYSILFEPMKIGPVTARNRFFQVPHCNGMGHLRPQADAATRAIKAEGECYPAEIRQHKDARPDIHREESNGGCGDDDPHRRNNRKTVPDSSETEKHRRPQRVQRKLQCKKR